MSLTQVVIEILKKNAQTNVVEVIRNGEIFHIDQDTKNSLAYKTALIDKELEKFEREGFNNEVITLKMFGIEINLPLLAGTYEKFNTMIGSILTDGVLDETEEQPRTVTLKDHLNEYAKFLEYKSYVLSMWSDMSYEERKHAPISDLKAWVFNAIMSTFEVDIDKMFICFTDIEVEIEHLCEILQKTMTC